MVIQHPAVPVPTVIYLDDDQANRQAFLAAFRRDLRILLAANVEEVWQHLAQHQVQVLIADQRLPGPQGSEILAMVRERFPSVRRMILTGYCDIQAVVDAINRGGVSRYLYKPWDPAEVLKAVKEAHAEYLSENDRLDHLEKLTEANRQLEFALRQRLLS